MRPSTKATRLHHEPSNLRKGLTFLGQMAGFMFWIGALCSLVIVAGAAVN